MMKTKSLYFIVLLLLLSWQLFAQPLHGLCGGGLIIDNLYNKELERIDVTTDKSVKIRNFVLDGKKVLSETLPAILYLPPVNRYSYQRMYIIYKHEAMVIDFINVRREDFYDCVKNRMDSIVFQKGYFKYYGNKNSSNLDHLEGSRSRSNYKSIGKGITLHNRKQLIKGGVLEYNRTIDFSFLTDQNPPALHYFEKATNYLKSGQEKLALKEVKKGNKNNKNPENCEILYLLCDIYTKNGQYKKAIENISKIINLKCRRDYNIYKSTFQYEENISANYKKRIDLLIKVKEYSIALQDYDTLYYFLRNGNERLKVFFERANFKLKYLKDYSGVIDELKNIIDQFSDNTYKNDFVYGYFEFYNIYILLAEAEYLNGDKKSAYKHWLMAAECGYSNNPMEWDNIDSIIRQNPEVPELFLARALVKYSTGRILFFEGDSHLSLENMKTALDDINKAEGLGMQDYRINMYRAVMLDRLGRHDEALAEINLAISKNNQDPRCFSWRTILCDDAWLPDYHFDENYPDYIQDKKLFKDWKWERY